MAGVSNRGYVYKQVPHAEDDGLVGGRSRIGQERNTKLTAMFSGLGLLSVAVLLFLYVVPLSSKLHRLPLLI